MVGRTTILALITTVATILTICPLVLGADDDDINWEDFLKFSEYERDENNLENIMNSARGTASAVGEGGNASQDVHSSSEHPTFRGYNVGSTLHDVQQGQFPTEQFQLNEHTVLESGHNIPRQETVVETGQYPFHQQTWQYPLQQQTVHPYGQYQSHHEREYTGNTVFQLEATPENQTHQFYGIQRQPYNPGYAVNHLPSFAHALVDSQASSSGVEKTPHFSLHNQFTDPLQNQFGVPLTNNDFGVPLPQQFDNSLYNQVEVPLTNNDFGVPVPQQLMNPLHNQDEVAFANNEFGVPQQLADLMIEHAQAPIQYQGNLFVPEPDYAQLTQNQNLYNDSGSGNPGPSSSTVASLLPSVPSAKQSIGEINAAQNEYERRNVESMIRANGGVCMLNINRLPIGHGMITEFKTLRKPYGSNFIYPIVADYIAMATGDSFLLSCDAYGNHLIKRTLDQQQDDTLKYMPIMCDKSGILRNMLDDSTDFSEYICLLSPKPILILVDQRFSKCPAQLTHYRILFRWNAKKNTNILLDLCVDDSNSRTVYVRTKLSNKLRGQQMYRSTVEYIRTNNNYFKEVVVHQLYDNLEVQKDSLLQQIDLEDFNKLTQEKYYLTPGRLAGRYAYVYEMEQKASLYYGNTQPMWSNLARNNWEVVELAVSKLAAKSEHEIEVISGIHDVQLIRNKQGIPVSIYLGRSDIRGINLVRNKHDGYILQPIPKIFYKIVYNTHSKDCVAIVALNSTIDMKRRECFDVMSNIEWLSTVIPHRVDLGIVYACACGLGVGKFHPPELSPFPVGNLLKE